MTSEKFPITVERLKCFIIKGHSNADGWAGSSPMFASAPHLGPGADPQGRPEQESWWKNIYVFTSDIPWATTPGVPVASDIGNGEWLEMTISNPETFDAVHPFPSPYRYPNVRGSCYPNWTHNASPPPGDLSFGTHGGGTHVGFEIPLAWLWSHHWQEQVGFVKMALSSTFFLRQEKYTASTPIAAATWFDVFGFSNLSPGEGRPDTAVDPSYGFFGWWMPYEDFSWAPSQDSLYGLWWDKMQGAQSMLPTVTNSDGESVQCKMDVRLIIPYFGENDALTRTVAVLSDTFEKAVRAYCARVRQDIFDADMTTLAAHEIAIVWPLPHDAYDSGEGTLAVVRAALLAVEADDPFFRTVVSSNWSTLDDEGFTYPIPTSTSHFGPEGYIQAATDIYEAFKEIAVEPYDALDGEQRVTVGDVMERVRTYYTRARVSTDVDDPTLFIHINGALFHILNMIGDQAWFLRRRAPIALTAGANTPITLPRYVHRLLKIETPEDVLRAVPFEQTGFVEGGKLQILMRERASGTYTLHFITQPRELTSTGQLVPLPFQMIEWLVVETCRRLSRSSSNALLQASLEGEVKALQTDSMRNMGAMQRSRNDRLQKQLQLPNPRRRRGGRFWPWGNSY